MQRNLLILFILFQTSFNLLVAGSDSSYIPFPYFPENEIVSEIDSIKITSEEFFYSYEYGPAFVKRKKDSKQRHLNYMINEKLLALDGYSRGVDTNKQAVDMLKEFKNDLATEELFKQDILYNIEISSKEIDTVISKKLLELEIKWLYAENPEEINNYIAEMKNGILFDSIFNSQFNDSVFYDERYLKIDRYKLEQKNPALAKVIDSLRVGEVSLPIHVEDGWYIIKLDNVWRNITTTESEYKRLKQEAENALKKKKMDVLSDQYVNDLMFENNPVIKRNTFNLLRSYLGNYLLDPEKYKEWDLTSKLNEAIKNLNISDEKEYAEAVLVESEESSFSLDDFLAWYRNRSLYVKLNKSDLQNFSGTLEGLVWLMVRDRLLSARARERGLDKLEHVKKESEWWKDKIVSSMVKSEIANSVVLENKEVAENSDNEVASVKASEEFTAKLLRKVLSLKQKHPVIINEDVLRDIPVSVENDPKTIDFYTVKRGGLIPRTPYPTIDYDWVNWE